MLVVDDDDDDRSRDQLVFDYFCRQNVVPVRVVAEVKTLGRSSQRRASAEHDMVM